MYFQNDITLSFKWQNKISSCFGMQRILLLDKSDMNAIIDHVNLHVEFFTSYGSHRCISSTKQPLQRKAEKLVPLCCQIVIPCLGQSGQAKAYKSVFPQGRFLSNPQLRDQHVMENEYMLENISSLTWPFKQVICTLLQIQRFTNIISLGKQFLCIYTLSLCPS